MFSLLLIAADCVPADAPVRASREVVCQRVLPVLPTATHPLIPHPTRQHTHLSTAVRSAPLPPSDNASTPSGPVSRRGLPSTIFVSGTVQTIDLDDATFASLERHPATTSTTLDPCNFLSV